MFLLTDYRRAYMSDENLIFLSAASMTAKSESS